MKNIFNSFKKSIKSVLTHDPYDKTDLESLYFKKVAAKDLPNENTTKNQANCIIEDNIPSLNRTILTGITKKMIQSKIQELVFNNRFNTLRPEIKELCEIVDYACKNNTPVRISYLKILIPSLEIENISILNEKDYKEWLANKSENESIPNDVFKIDDEMGVREEERSRRGRNSYSGWKAPKNPNKWTKL